MLKTHENQVIAVFIEDRIYTCLEGNFPILAFREFLYGYIKSQDYIHRYLHSKYDLDVVSSVIYAGELSVIYAGEEISPETTIIDLSDAKHHLIDVCFRVNNVIIFQDCLELFTLNVLKP